MKNLLLGAMIVTLFSACSKEEENSQMAVKFSVTGQDVTEVKFNYKNTISGFKVPFSGTRDTTIYANIGETISVDAKSTGGALKGQIFVNNNLAAEQIDADTDGDGKTQVKTTWTIK